MYFFAIFPKHGQKNPKKGNKNTKKTRKKVYFSVNLKVASRACCARSARRGVPPSACAAACAARACRKFDFVPQLVSPESN